MRIVKIYSTENCGACIKLEKALQRMNIKYTKFMNVQSGINCYPTMIIYENDKEVERIEGFSPKRLNSLFTPHFTY